MNIDESTVVQPILGFGVEHPSGPQSPSIKITGVREQIQTKLKTTMKRKQPTEIPQQNLISSEEEDMFVATTSKNNNNKIIKKKNY